MSIRMPIQGFPTEPLLKVLPCYFVENGNAHAASGATTANRCYLTLFRIPKTITTYAIAAECTTLEAAKSWRIGLYRDMGWTPVGGALLAESGNIGTDATGAKEFITTLNLNQGWYWCALLVESTVAQFWRASWRNSYVELANQFTRGCYFEHSAFANPLPATCPAVTTLTSCPKFDIHRTGSPTD